MKILLSCSEFNIVLARKSVLSIATGLGTTYNLTSGDDINYREDCSVLGQCHIDWSYPKKL